MKLTKITILAVILALFFSGYCLAADPYDVSGIDLRDFLNPFRLGQVPCWDKYSPRDSTVDRDKTRHSFSLDRKGEVNVALWTRNDSGKTQSIAIHNDSAGMYLAEWTGVITKLYESPTIIEDGGNYYNPAVMRIWSVRMGTSIGGCVSITPRCREPTCGLKLKK